MKKFILYFLLLILSLAIPLSSQIIIPPGGGSIPGVNPESGIGLFAEIPSSPSPGDEYTILDAAASDDCTQGGGTAVTKCLWNGTEWQAFSSGLSELVVTYDGSSGEINDPGIRLPYPEIIVEVPAPASCENPRHFMFKLETGYARLWVCEEEGGNAIEVAGRPAFNSVSDGVGQTRTGTTDDPDLDLVFPDGNGVAFDISGTLPSVTATPKLKFPSQARGDQIAMGAAAWERKAVGGVGSIWKSDGTDPGWLAPPATRQMLLGRPGTAAAYTPSREIIGKAGVLSIADAVETDIISVTVPADTLYGGSTMHCVNFQVAVTWVRNHTSGNWVMRLYYGVTSISLTATYAQAATRYSSDVRLVICGNGATNVQTLWMGNNNSNNSPMTWAEGTAAIDSTSAQTAKVSFQWTANSGGANDFDVVSAWAEIIQ